MKNSPCIFSIRSLFTMMMSFVAPASAVMPDGLPMGAGSVTLREGKGGMRKSTIATFFAVCLVLCASTAFGAYDWDVAYHKWGSFNKNVMKLADEIVVNNRHAFEIQFTKKERSYDDEYHGKGMTSAVWRRVWAKDKTIVSGWATANKKFVADSIETIDPEFVFAGGVHVGGSIKDLEKFFGASISEINESERSGIIYGSSQSGDMWFTLIMHKDGIITEIHAVNERDWPGGFPVPDSQKANDFIKNKRIQMGLPASVSPW